MSCLSKIYFIACSEDSIQILSTQTLELENTIKLQPGFKCFCYSPTKENIAYLDNDECIIACAKTGKIIRKILKNEITSINTMCFSPDGRNLVVDYIEGPVFNLSVETGLKKQLINKNNRSYHKCGIMSINFSYDGKYIATASADNDIKIWSESGDLLKTMKGHIGTVNTVCFSPDGKYIASGSDDNTIKLWSAETGDVIFTIKGNSQGVKCVQFSKDGIYLASCSSDKSIKIWMINSSLEPTISNNSILDYNNECQLVFNLCRNDQYGVSQTLFI